MDIVDTPHIQAEVAVLLAVEEHNLSSFGGLVRRPLWQVRHRSPLGSGSSIAEKLFDFRWASL